MSYLRKKLVLGKLNYNINTSLVQDKGHWKNDSKNHWWSSHSDGNLFFVCCVHDLKTTDQRVILRSQRPGQPPCRRPCYLTKRDPWHRISCVVLCGHKGMQCYHWRHRRQRPHHTQGPGWINHRALLPEAQQCPLHSTAVMQHKLKCIMYRSHGPSTLLQLHLLKTKSAPAWSFMWLQFK